ncbi:MAG: hypothetical protein ACTIJ9_07320 [Aequorivita sp.]
MKNKNKFIIISLIICYFLSFVAVLSINHFGKFVYKHDASNLPLYDDEGYFLWEVDIPWETPVLLVKYTSYFGSEILIQKPGFDVRDMEFTKNSTFYAYPNVLQYYINGTLKDYRVILLIGTGLFLCVVLLRKFIKV